MPSKVLATARNKKIGSSCHQVDAGYDRRLHHFFRRKHRSSEAFQRKRLVNHYLKKHQVPSLQQKKGGQVRYQEFNQQLDAHHEASIAFLIRLKEFRGEILTAMKGRQR